MILRLSQVFLKHNLAFSIFKSTSRETRETPSMWRPSTRRQFSAEKSQQVKVKTRISLI